MKKETNKKVLILTIIAVVTLLVIVIGSAYAYFAVADSNSGTNTNTTTVTPDVGVVSLSGGSVMHIRLKASDMANNKQGTPYYATASEADYSEEAEIIEVATATVVGGSDTASYSCTFDLNTVADGDMLDLIKSGDAKIVYSGLVTGEEDLTNLTSTRTITVNLTGNGASDSVNAYVVFNNTTEDQTNLAGKTLTLEINADNFSCNISGEKVLSDEAKALAATIASTEVGGEFRVAHYISESLTQDNRFILLAKEENKALVLYSHSGGAGGYGYITAFDSNGNTDWKDSTVRTSLNSSFLPERKELNELVMDTTVYTRSSSNIDEFYTTTDKVFILSEADRLGTVQGVAVSYEDSPNDYSIAPDADGNILPDSVLLIGNGLRFDADYMWLRTPGTVSGTVRYTSTRTSGVNGEDVPSNVNVVYPIMWVDISSANE